MAKGARSSTSSTLHGILRVDNKVRDERNEVGDSGRFSGPSARAGLATHPMAGISISSTPASILFSSSCRR